MSFLALSKKRVLLHKIVLKILGVHDFTCSQQPLEVCSVQIIEIWSLLVVRAHHPQGDSACRGSGQNGTLSLLVLLVISSGRRCRYCTGTVMYPLAM